jgi:hypothetical protein
MRKAKFMLATLGIVSALSTSLAFKARTFSTHYVYTGVKDSGVCTTKINGAILCFQGPPNVAASTTSLASNCPNAFICEVAD